MDRLSSTCGIAGNMTKEIEWEREKGRKKELEFDAAVDFAKVTSTRSGGVYISASADAGDAGEVLNDTVLGMRSGSQSPVSSTESA